jgi:hypothetical protein
MTYTTLPSDLGAGVTVEAPASGQNKPSQRKGGCLGPWSSHTPSTMREGTGLEREITEKTFLAWFWETFIRHAGQMHVTSVPRQIKSQWAPALEDVPVSN